MKDLLSVIVVALLGACGATAPMAESNEASPLRTEAEAQDQSIPLAGVAVTERRSTTATVPVEQPAPLSEMAVTAPLPHAEAQTLSHVAKQAERVEAAERALARTQRQYDALANQSEALLQLPATTANVARLRAMVLRVRQSRPSCRSGSKTSPAPGRRSHGQGQLLVE